jgi:4-hydroxybenzoate polyprenyltransferase
MAANKFPDLLCLMRVQQWPKNVFVLTGLLFGHAWHDSHLVCQTLAATFAFCLVASAIYIINDIADRESDRHHPYKYRRPLVTEAVSIRAALILALALFVCGAALGFHVTRTVGVILIVYAIMNLAYSWGLKNVVILDVLLIATGFMLRILAGTLGIGIAPSNWLLLCGFLLTLLLGFMKRRSELMTLSDDGAAHRAVLARYSAAFLDRVIAVAAISVIATYGLYTLSPKTVQIHGTPYLILTLPLVVYGMTRVLFLLYRCHTEMDPTQALLRDPHMLFAGFLWLGFTIALIG